MHLELARQYILDRLDQELPPSLTYHSPNHTKRVTAASLRIGIGEGLEGDDLIILETAALYHDAGFLIEYQDHEKQGCDLIRNCLPDFGYSSETIEFICEAVLATRIPQNPKSKIAEILCDADLDYLGTDDFYKIGNTLFREFVNYGVLKNEMEWNRMQVRFMESHTYFTKTAITEREVRKQLHLQEVKAIVSGYEE